MPGLIQVPSRKEDIADFLADGQTRSVPAVTSSDINDGDILNATQTLDLGGGSYKFAITLPSGRLLESAGISPDYSRRDAGLQWVEAVRGSIVGDYESAAEDSARAARASAPIATGDETQAPVQRGLGPEPTGPVPSSGVHADPVEYAKQQLSAALQRLSAADQAAADVKKWSQVVAMLTGEKPLKKRKKKKRAVKPAV